MDVKERIRFKARDLFLQYGIRSVSMDDIANSLGMSKKTLYQYYADKDELVDAVVDSHINEIQEDCLACRKLARDAVHEIFITMDRIMAEFNNMNPMVLYDMEKFHFRSWNRFKEHKDKFIASTIEENIQWGIKEDLYRNDINIDMIVKYRLESMMIAFNVGVFPPGKYNLAAVSEQILIQFVYGLASIKGHKLIQKYNEQRQKKLNYDEYKK